MATTEPVKNPSSLGDRVKSLRLPPEPKRQPVSAGPIVLGVLLLVAAAAGAYWYLTAAGEAPTQTTPAESARVGSQTTTMPGVPQADAPPASTAPLVAASGEVALEAKGYIIPAHQILVSPKVSGMIVSLNFEEGMRVQKGYVLAELESVDYQADVQRAKAVLASARQRLLELETGSRPEEILAAEAELHEAAAQREQLYLDWKRNMSLRGTRTVTEKEYEQSESAYKAMDRRVVRLQNNLKMLQDGPRIERIDAARADVGQAEAELRKAEWRLDNCTIVAPVSGTILKKNAEEGNIVNPIAFNGSYSLCEMADLADLEVDLSIQERDVARIFKGQKCKVRPEAFPDRIYEGVVSRLMPIADRAKGAIPVRVKLTVPAEEEGQFLKPEMSAVVSFYK